MENNKITIDILSDTHNKHEKIVCGGADILIHSGDFTSRGTPIEVHDFMLWLEKQDYEHKIVIPGNHDWDLEKNFDFWKNEFSLRGIFLLNDSGVIIKDMYDPSINIKIWGSPVSPWFHSWAFNRHRTEKEANEKHPWIKPHWDLIPKDTEILITHGPPHGVLDLVARGGFNVGCEHLANRIRETQVKLHVFGHIHEGRGFKYDAQTTYVNGSSLDENYFPTDNKPMRIIREVCQDGSIVYVL